MNISKATIQRLPKYLRILQQLKQRGQERVMSYQIANNCNVSADTVRRDLMFVNHQSKTSSGYEIESLIESHKTDANGHIVFEYLFNSEGEYYISEITPSKGYKLDTGWCYVFNAWNGKWELYNKATTSASGISALGEKSKEGNLGQNVNNLHTETAKA